MHTSAHTMSHANVLASSSPSGACVHMRKEIFALHGSLSFSVLRRLHSDPEGVCFVYWVPWLNVNFLRWRGGHLPGLVLLPLARHHSCPAALHFFLLVQDQFEPRAL